MARQGYVSLEGSHREPQIGSRRVGPADPDEHLEVTVVLRRPAAAEPATRSTSAGDTTAERGGPEDELRRVEEFASNHGLQVVESRPAERSVVLGGTVSDFENAFDVELSQYETQGDHYRGRTGTINIPIELQDMVAAVLGLDNRRQARAHLRVLGPADDNRAVRAAAAGRSFRPTDLAALYDFPQGDGAGECIAIIELGGGFRRADLRAYFADLDLPTPQVVAVSVDHGHNRPDGPQGADGEVMLDIEVAGAIAPGAKIVVYFAPNTDRGFFDAISRAVNDTGNKPSVISISWGGPESSWTPQAMDLFDGIFADAGQKGISVFCAAGDSGSGDGVTDGHAHVDFPASSPHVVACGGTRLVVSDGTAEETVWTTNGATGGGVSDYFDMPQYQQGANVPPSVNSGHRHGRGLPDVAGDADPATGYLVRVDGSMFVIGGTSAVAPLWAGLTARLNQLNDAPLGWLNAALYDAGQSNQGAFADVTAGNNGAYQAGPGWDACTGWGSPRGQALAAALGIQ